VSKLLDHLAGEQRRWNDQAKDLCRLQIDDEFNLRRLLNREVPRLLTLQDPSGVNSGLTVSIGIARSIAHQATTVGELSQFGYRRQSRSQGQSGYVAKSIVEEWIRCDQNRTNLLLAKARKRSVKLHVTARI